MARERSQGILGFLALVGASVGLGYGAWILLTRPPQRATERRVTRVVPVNDSLEFVSVAGEGVDLEVVAPDGRRTSTVGATGTATRIAGSEANVDCPDFATSGRREAACTASIHVPAPRTGDYTVIARAADPRTTVISVGWATTSQSRRGAFDVRVQVARGGATSFAIIVIRDNVSQRSEPRPGVPRP